jgi:hypothetical protein
MADHGWRRRAEALLRERGAAEVAHPGGTLFEHVSRVATLLGQWGGGDDLQAAGLCHACYGTDGFGVALFGLDERAVVRDVIGSRAEAFVYRYASCARRRVHSRLGAAPLWVFDRFTDRALWLGDVDAAAFVELTAANELDLVHVDPAGTATWAPAFLTLLRHARHRLSDGALRAWFDALGVSPADAADPGG